MSISVQVYSQVSINHLTLEQCVLASQVPLTAPYFFQFDNADLLLDSQCQSQASALGERRVNQSTSQPTSNKQELVVFSDLPMATLLAMLQHSQLSITALGAINTRNQQTSYRFNIKCEDFTGARQRLTQFSQQHNFEAAILQDAPQLSQPGLLVMDMDSTTIAIECIDEIAILAGVGEQVAKVTELAMLGQLDFAQSLHQRVATLAGAPEQILEQVANNLPLMPGINTLIDTLKQHHWRIAIASGGFTYFSDHLKKLLALDAAFANQLEIHQGKLTGKVLGEVVDAQTKAQSLSLLSNQYHIAKSQTVAVGDGANDLPMMKHAHLGVAFHAKPIVLEQADSSIKQKGLDCLLHWLA